MDTCCNPPAAAGTSCERAALWSLHKPQSGQSGFSHPTTALRACAVRWLGGVRAVAPVDEFGADQRGDGEGGLGESVLGAPVGVAVELAEVRQPRVGAFDGHRSPDGVVVLCVAAPGGRRRAQTTSSVPASVHARGLWRCHSRGPGAGSARRRAVPDPRRRRRWGSQGSVVAVRAVGRPAHRDARPVTQQRPLPAAFVAVSGVGARAGAAAGGLRTGRRRRSLNA